MLTVMGELVSLKTAHEWREYYCKHLDDSLENLPQEVTWLISKYATEGVDEIGALVDVKDVRIKCTWSIAEVIDVELESKQSRVHYLGWPVHYDEWINWEGDRLAPVFTYTKVQRPLETVKNPEIIEIRGENLKLKDLEPYGFNPTQAIYVLACFSRNADAIPTTHAINAMISWSVFGKNGVSFEVHQACTNALQQ
jgi:hypothetical protein